MDGNRQAIDQTTLHPANADLEDTRISAIISINQISLAAWMVLVPVLISQMYRRATAKVYRDKRMKWRSSALSRLKPCFFKYLNISSILILSLVG